MDLEQIRDNVSEFLGSSLVQITLTIIAVLVVQLILRRTIGRIVQKVVRSHHYESKVDEGKRERTLVTIFSTAIAVVLWTVAIIVILWQLDVNIAALMTGAGLIGIVVGFGAQSAIKDFLGGIFIITENQYRVGDIVTLTTGAIPVSGVVEDITIRITRLRDMDGNMHIVPNGSVAVVTNMSFKYANVNVDISVSYESDIDKVQKVIDEVGEALARDAEWKESIFEPIKFLRVDGFEDMGVRVKALGKVEPAKQWDVAGEFRRRVINAFEKNHIKIPQSQLIVHNQGNK